MVAIAAIAANAIFGFDACIALITILSSFGHLTPTAIRQLLFSGGQTPHRMCRG